MLPLPVMNQEDTTNPMQEITSSKSLFSFKLIGAGFVMFVLGLGVGFGIGNFVSKKSFESIEISPTPIVTQATSETIAPGDDDRFKNLPGFDLNYGQDWKLQTKEFGQLENTLGFVSTYFPTCHESCMGLRVVKDNTKIDLIFDIAQDTSGIKCSNTVEFVSLGNEWFRFKDKSGYFYAQGRNVYLDHTLDAGVSGTMSSDPDEQWSTVENTPYKVCLLGNGSFLKYGSGSPVTGLGVGILMEFPRVYGSIKPGDMADIDNIIKSIQGL